MDDRAHPEKILELGRQPSATINIVHAVAGDGRPPNSGRRQGYTGPIHAETRPRAETDSSSEILHKRVRFEITIITHPRCAPVTTTFQSFCTTVQYAAPRPAVPIPAEESAARSRPAPSQTEALSVSDGGAKWI